MPTGIETTLNYLSCSGLTMRAAATVSVELLAAEGSRRAYANGNPRDGPRPQCGCVILKVFFLT
jgi:hypothetical protein